MKRTPITKLKDNLAKYPWFDDVFDFETIQELVTNAIKEYGLLAKQNIEELINSKAENDQAYNYTIIWMVEEIQMRYLEKHLSTKSEQRAKLIFRNKLREIIPSFIQKIITLIALDIDKINELAKNITDVAGWDLNNDSNTFESMPNPADLNDDTSYLTTDSAVNKSQTAYYNPYAVLSRLISGEIRVNFSRMLRRMDSLIAMNYSVKTSWVPECGGEFPWNT